MDNSQMYNYYRGMYDNYAGSPKAQMDILNQYYDYMNPMNQQKIQQQQNFTNMMNSMLGMGGPSMGGPSMSNMAMSPMGGGMDMGSPSLGGDPYGLSKADMWSKQQQPQTLGMNTGQPDLSQFSIDTNVQNNSLGGNLSKIARPFEQVAGGLSNIFGETTGNTGQDQWRSSNPLDYFVNHLLSGLGNEGATKYIDSHSVIGPAGQVTSTSGKYAGTPEERNTKLTGQAAIDYIQNNPNAGYKVLNDVGLGIGDQATKSYGLLDDILGGAVSPFTFVNNAGEYGNFLGRGGKIDFLNPNSVKESAAKIGYTPQNLSLEEYKNFVEDPAGFAAKTGTKVGESALALSGINPSSFAGKVAYGTGLGAGYGYMNSELGNELRDTAIGGASGAAGAAAFYGLGKLGTNVMHKLGYDPGGSKTLSGIDQKIADQVDNMKAQGLDDKMISMKTGLGSGENNARFNFITQNLQGKEKVDALQALANRAAKEGDDKVLGVLGNDSAMKMLGMDKAIKPNITVKAPNAVTGAADDRTPVDRLIDLFTSKETVPKTDSSGIAQMQGNVGEKFGKNLQFDAMGIKSDPSNLNFYKDEKQTRAVLDSVFDALGQPKDAKGMQVVTDTLGQARNELLKNSGWEGANMNDIVNRAYTKLKEVLPTTKLSRDDVVRMLNSKLGDLTGTNADISKLNDFLTGKLKIDPETLQNIATSTYDARTRLLKGGINAPSADVQVLGSLDQSIREALNKNIVGYQRSNDLYRRLYDTLADRATTFNSGNQVSQLGKTDVLNMIGKQGLKYAGKAIEGVSSGDLLNVPKQIANNVTNSPIVQNAMGQVGNVMSNPAGGTVGNYLAPRLGAILNQQGQPLEQQTMTANPTYASQGNFGGPNIEQMSQNPRMGGQNQGMGGGNPMLGNPDVMRQVITMGILGGQIDPQQGQLALQLLGSNKPKLSAGQQQQIQGYQNSLDTLDEIENSINTKGGQFGPANIGGKIRDLGGIFSDPEREAIKTQIGFAISEMVKQLSGTNASDKERQYIESKFPSLNDAPDVAMQKLQSVRTWIKNKMNNATIPIADLGQ